MDTDDKVWADVRCVSDRISAYVAVLADPSGISNRIWTIISGCLSLFIFSKLFFRERYLSQITSRPGLCLYHKPPRSRSPSTRLHLPSSPHPTT